MDQHSPCVRSGSFVGRGRLVWGRSLSWTLAGTCVLALLWGSLAVIAGAPDPPTRSYYVYATAESDDEVAIVRYGPEGVEVVKTLTVGSFPAEIEGPHGVSVDPNGRHWYVSIAHGFPYGSVH